MVNRFVLFNKGGTLLNINSINLEAYRQMFQEVFGINLDNLVKDKTGEEKPGVDYVKILAVELLTSLLGHSWS